MKKIFAFFLILLQCFQPATAAGLFDGLGSILGAQGLKAVSETLAGGFGMTQYSPKNERVMDAALQRQADEARTLFELAQSDTQSVEIYDPANLVLAKKQIERWKTFVAKTKNKSTLSNDELRGAANALLPFLRYYDQGNANKPDYLGNMVIVPAGQTAKINLAGYCMDRTVAAPQAAEKLQLVPIQKLISAESVGLYQSMMQFSAQHIEKRGEIQNLVWGLRHASDPYPPIKELNANQVVLLDEATPNGAAQYRQYLSQQAQNGKDIESRKQLFRKLLGTVQNQLGIPLPDPSVSGYTPSDSKALVEALTHLPVEGTPQAGSEYTLLSPGIAAKTVANNLHNISVEIKNTTPLAYVFDANQYAGQSTRVTQRVAFGGLLGRDLSDSKNFLQRLHEVLQILEIPQLKRLQDQVQNTIDNLADQPGNSELQFAGLALATAMNQVLLPTSVLDVVAPESKLLGVTGKITSKEIAAVENGLVNLERNSNTDAVIKFVEDMRFGPANRGPLPETVANTFRSASYNQATLSEPAILYRVSGGSTAEIGQYWTTVRPTGPLQAQIDLALKPEWENTATQVTTIRVPAGQTIYMGAAASQGGAQIGGGSQVFISRVDPSWVIP